MVPSCVRSTGGQSWDVSYAGDPAVTVLNFVDAVHGWGVTDNGEAQTLITTADGGKSWARVQTPPAGKISQVKLIKPDAGFVIGTEALLATSSGGRTWTQHPAVQHAQLVDFVTMLDGWMVQASGDVQHPWILRRSRDGGSSWVTVPLPTKIQKAVAEKGLGIATVQGTPHGVWLAVRSLGAAAGSSPFAVLRGDPEGSSWTPVVESWQPPLGLSPTTAMMTGFGAEDESFAFLLGQCSACSNEEDQRAGTSGTAAINTTVDGGATWAGYTLPIRGEVALTQPIASFPTLRRGWVAFGGELYTTTDRGKTWTKLSSPN